MQHNQSKIQQLFIFYFPSVAKSLSHLMLFLLVAFHFLLSVLIYFTYLLLHTLPILSQDNSFSMGVDRRSNGTVQSPVLLHTQCKQNESAQCLYHLLSLFSPLSSLHKAGRCFLTAFLLAKYHSACFPFVVSYTEGLFLISWLQEEYEVIN